MLTITDAGREALQKWRDDPTVVPVEARDLGLLKIFLVSEPLEAAFTGPVFALGLWVCLNYGFVMSAPLLRIEWGLFGVAGVRETLEEVSPQSAIHILALSTTAAVVGALHIADRIRPKAVTLCGGLAAFFAVQTLHLREEPSARRPTGRVHAEATRSREGAPAS